MGRTKKITQKKANVSQAIAGEGGAASAKLPAVPVIDNANMVVQNRKADDGSNASQHAQERTVTRSFSPLQKKENKTGLPDQLKSGVEALSGQDISDVKVHYNSPKPAQLHAHAYAQGTEIHVAPGQEKHLPHEAWHTVQQKQGRVTPTTVQRQPDGDDYENFISGLQSRPMESAPGEAMVADDEPAPRLTRARSSSVLAPPGESGGVFGSDEYQAQWQPGMALLGGAKAAGSAGLKGMEAAAGLGVKGAGKSLSTAGAAIKASGSFAAAPKNWAKEGIAGTDSKLKKAGYAVGGALGTLVTAPLGLAAAGVSAGAGLVGAGASLGLGAAGAATAGVAGLTGAATGAALGGVAMAGGGAYKAGKMAKGAIKDNVNKELLGVYKPGATHEQLGDRGPSALDAAGEFNPDGTRKNYGAIGGREGVNYGLLGGGGAAAVGASITDMASKGNVIGASIAEKGFVSPLAGGAEAFGVLGAAGGAFGAAASLMDAQGAAKEAGDSANSKQTRVLAGAQTASSLSDATKSSATAAYNIASLVDAHGVAAAGAQIAAGGASIAMGTIDMIRGGYGAYTADQRQTLLEGIKKASNDSVVQGMAAEAIETQKRAKLTGGAQVLKGAIAVAGGILLAASMATPIGWMLLGAGAVVGIGAAIANWWSKRQHKKAVVMRELGVEPAEMTAYEKERQKRIDAIEKETRPLTKKRKEKMNDLNADPLYGSKDPLKRKLAEYKFTGVGHCYTNYINATANKIYTDGVVGRDDRYDGIITNIGLKIERKGDDATKWKPIPEKIAKALGG